MAFTASGLALLGLRRTMKPWEPAATPLPLRELVSQARVPAEAQVESQPASEPHDILHAKSDAPTVNRGVT